MSEILGKHEIDSLLTSINTERKLLPGQLTRKEASDLDKKNAKQTVTITCNYEVLSLLSLAAENAKLVYIPDNLKNTLKEAVNIFDKENIYHLNIEMKEIDYLSSVYKIDRGE